MLNKKSNGLSAQGADNQVIEENAPSLKDIETWITRDLGSSITFLQGIQQDTELKQQMAVFLQGRLANARNRPSPDQVNAEFGKGPRIP